MLFLGYSKFIFQMEITVSLELSSDFYISKIYTYKKIRFSSTLRLELLCLIINIWMDLTVKDTLRFIMIIYEKMYNEFFWWHQLCDKMIKFYYLLQLY